MVVDGDGNARPCAEDRGGYDRTECRRTGQEADCPPSVRPLGRLTLDRRKRLSRSRDIRCNRMECSAKVTIPCCLNPWWGTLALAIGAVLLTVPLHTPKPVSYMSTPPCPTTISLSPPSERYVPPTTPGSIPTVPPCLFSRKIGQGGGTKDDLRESWYRVYREVGPPPTVDSVPVVTPSGVCSWRSSANGE